MHAVEIEKSVFNWNDMDVVGHLVLLDSNGASVNMKWASAVITLLRKVTSLENKCQI